MVFSEAFADADRDLVAYGGTYVDLAPGVDARATSHPRSGRSASSSRRRASQEQQAVNDALGPLLTILVAIGALAFVATGIAAAQILQRDQDRSRTDDEHLRRLGMVRGQVVLALVAPATLAAAMAVLVALVVMAATSPLAPAGPLHDLDPEQGVIVDPLVAVIGVLVIAITVVGLAGVLTLRRRGAAQSASARPGVPAWAPQRPTARAGLRVVVRRSRPAPARPAIGRVRHRGRRGRRRWS